MTYPRTGKSGHFWTPRPAPAPATALGGTPHTKPAANGGLVGTALRALAGLLVLFRVTAYMSTAQFTSSQSSPMSRNVLSAERITQSTGHLFERLRPPPANSSPTTPGQARWSRRLTVRPTGALRPRAGAPGSKGAWPRTDPGPELNPARPLNRNRLAN